MNFGLKTFPPGYFALVMATGIVAIASGMLDFPRVATALSTINLASYAILWLLNIARLIRHPREMSADFASHRRGTGFLTFIAATAVVGCECQLTFAAPAAALALWYFAIALWIVLLNGWLAAAVMLDPKPSLDRGIDGGWFLLTVSTQSVAVLGSYVAPRLPAPEIAIFICLAFYMLGAMFYLWVIGLVLFRWLFFPMERKDALGPNYWINSGAMAITALAGARLIADTSAPLAQFLTAFNLLFWATATWWIPFLFLVNAWRSLIERFPIRYEPGWWSMVFPLGMYAACTWEYADAAHFLFLEPIARAALFIAWAAWALTATGMLRAILRKMEGRSGKT